jgi:hypothetical protein
MGRSGRGRSRTPTASGTTWRCGSGSRRARPRHSDHCHCTGPRTRSGRSPQERPHRRCGGGSVAALQGDARQVYSETTTDSLALLDERRVNLSHSRTRTINQLHGLLRELMAGGAPTSLTPAGAAAGLRRIPSPDPDRIRVALGQGSHRRRPAVRRPPGRQRQDDHRNARRARHRAARDRRRRTLVLQNGLINMRNAMRGSGHVA